MQYGTRKVLFSSEYVILCLRSFSRKRLLNQAFAWHIKNLICRYLQNRFKSQSSAFNDCLKLSSSSSSSSLSSSLLTMVVLKMLIIQCKDNNYKSSGFPFGTRNSNIVYFLNLVRLSTTLWRTWKKHVAQRLDLTNAV